MTSPRNDPSAPPDEQPEADTFYSLEITARLSGVDSEAILYYCEHGLISPVADSGNASLQFPEEALRTLRRIEHLRATCEMNVAGLRLVLGLLEENERLRGSLRLRT